MPIRVQNDLPVKEILEQENIFVMDEFRAAHQDIRPISIGLLNLMPLKEDTELQILRALSNTPLQVDVTFVRVTSHVSKNTSTSHIYKFYEAFEDIKNKKFDGSWSGRRRMLYLRSICAGEPRQGSTIIMELTRYCFLKSVPVCTGIV